MDTFLTNNIGTSNLSSQLFSRAQASGYNALMFAAEAGQLDTVSSLLRANAQVSLTNKVRKCRFREISAESICK